MIRSSRTLGRVCRSLALVCICRGDFRCPEITPAFSAPGTSRQFLLFGIETDHIIVVQFGTLTPVSLLIFFTVCMIIPPV